MKFKFASVVLALFSLLGIGVIAFSGVEDKPFVNVFSYLVVFVLIPGYGAYGAWYKRRKALLLALMVLPPRVSGKWAVIAGCRIFLRYHWVFLLATFQMGKVIWLTFSLLLWQCFWQYCFGG